MQPVKALLSELLRPLCVGTCCLFSLSTGRAAEPASVDRQDVSIEQIYRGFRNPPPEARPFVRWWWNNNQVEEAEIRRELDLLQAAGVGGVEINPIACRGPKSAAKVLPWRSPEWDRMLHLACREARARGLVVDLIAGSGWPFGGEFLRPDDQIMRVSVIEEQVTGPISFNRAIADVIKRRKGTVAFVAVYPKHLDSLAQVQDATQAINADGVLEIDMGEGERVVAFGIFEQGYRKVVNGAVGAAGPTMDHMQRSVTRSYLDRLAGVEKTWGEPLSTYVRAIFCDSIETAGANWTHDMVERFKQRKGYDVTPYLPLVIDGERDAWTASPELADRLRRVRYDWNEHNVAVFLENFTREYASFCHEHNLLSRYQAYGTPYLMGMAEGYLIPDIPESNNWLYSVDPLDQGRFTSSYTHGYMVWTKYASAGGRLRGKKIISTEAMTNTRKVFQTTLATIKQADDMNFIAGMTHSVLHGFNYVPPDVPFPGWIRYGSFFSEHNPWWPFLPLWLDYNARLSHVFQETKPIGEIALLGPTPDLWSRTGLTRPEFHTTPDYFHQLWESIAQLGGTCDYLHEGVIQQADVSKGRLRYGPMAYSILMVVDMETMQPETAEAIQRLAETGGRVIYVNRTPTRSPGLVAAETNDGRVAAAAAATLQAGAKTIPPPGPNASLGRLRTWTKSALDLAGFRLPMEIETPRDGLYALRHQAPQQDVLFFANSYREESSKTCVRFALGNRGLWRWNPETGERTPYDLPYDKHGFEIHLAPLESILLVTGENRGPEVGQDRSADGVEALILDQPWTVEFNPVQSTNSFAVELASLSDFTDHNDPRVKRFSGTAVYATSFELTSTSYSTLHLGQDNDFISEVQLNGQTLGVNWYGTGQFDISEVIRKGRNNLTIRYTTTLWNHMKKNDLRPTGLMGPIRLLAHQ